jgi:hypothetical protein
MADDVGRVGDADQALVNHAAARHGPSGFDPSRDEQIRLLESALEDIAEWYSPEGMGTVNELAAIALEALVDLDDLRDRDRDRSGEASETRSGSTEGESAGRKASPETQPDPHTLANGGEYTPSGTTEEQRG